jgi:hypothetical protein
MVTRRFLCLAVTKCLLACAASQPGAVAADAARPTEADFYRIQTLEIPAQAHLEVGALEWIPDGRLAVASRRGEIWMVSDPCWGWPGRMVGCTSHSGPR